MFTGKSLQILFETCLESTLGVCSKVAELWAKKKGQRLDPTFVNLKSNTMKNTVAKVRTFSKSARK